MCECVFGDNILFAMSVSMQLNIIIYKKIVGNILQCFFHAHNVIVQLSVVTGFDKKKYYAKASKLNVFVE